VVLDPGPYVYDVNGIGTPGPAALFIFGGRGGDNKGLLDFDEYYYNDVWSSTDGTALTREFGGYVPEFTDTIPTGADTAVITEPSDDGVESWWSPRCGHTVSLEKASPGNLNQRSLYLFGGQAKNWKDDGFQDDVWVWRPDVQDDNWKKDFTDEAIFATGDGSNFHYSEDAPSKYYVSPDSPVEYMRRFEIPTRLHKNNARRSEEKPYLADSDIEAMHSVGIFTIRDLAEAGLYTIIKLRGFDYPQVEEEDRLGFGSVCVKRELAWQL
jgi:hypothetical protein